MIVFIRKIVFLATKKYSYCGAGQVERHIKIMLIIAEKINGSRRLVGKAILDRDVNFIQKLAISQVEAGADYLDINAGTSTDREPDDLVWLINVVQDVVDKPLCLDSPNYKALLAGIGAAKQPPMINSISGEQDRLENVLPLVGKFKLKVLALALDSSVIQPTSEGRMEIIRKLFAATRGVGLPDSNVYVDPLVMSVATSTGATQVTFDVMRSVLTEFPEAHLTGGASNISFGLPARSLINRAFLTLAISNGLDSAIIDPTDRGLMEAFYAANAVLGYDRLCSKYTRAYRAGKIGVPAAPKLH
jgi:5-methyltetrahydrofolate--homocysteine methyltransferase